jgi:hypothetical protein
MGRGSSLLSYEVFLPPPLLQAFPLLIAGCVPLLLPVAMFVYITWEVGLPPSPVEFSSFHHSHKLSHSWLLGTHPHFCRSLSGLSGLFIYSSGKDSLPPIFSAQGTPPSFPRVFIVLIAYYSVSLFSPGGGQSVQGAMLLWPRLVCGSTTVLQSSPGRIFPSHLGTGNWRPGGPPGFSV